MYYQNNQIISVYNQNHQKVLILIIVQLEYLFTSGKLKHIVLIFTWWSMFSPIIATFFFSERTYNIINNDQLPQKATV
jgi:hypothetical protein